MACAFCDDHEVLARNIVENDLAYAFPTNTPIVPGHMLVVPKRHAETYEDLTVEEKGAIESLREKLRIALTKVFSAEGFNYAWNEAIVGGQTVPHFHLHIVPRKAGDAGVHGYEPRAFLYRPGSRAESPAEELKEVIASIQAVL